MWAGFLPLFGHTLVDLICLLHDINVKDPENYCMYYQVDSLDFNINEKA